MNLTFWIIMFLMMVVAPAIVIVLSAFFANRYEDNRVARASVKTFAANLDAAQARIVQLQAKNGDLLCEIACLQYDRKA